MYRYILACLLICVIGRQTIAQTAHQYNILARSYLYTNPDSTRLAGEAAIAAAMQARQTGEEGWGRIHAAKGLTYTGKITNAAVAINQLMARKSVVNNDTVMAEAYNLRAVHYRAYHKPDSAIQQYSEAERYARKANSIRDIGKILNNRAATFTEIGFLNRAADDYGAAYKIFAQLADTGAGIQVLSNLAQLYFNTQQYALAKDKATECLSIAEKKPQPVAMVTAYTVLGSVHKVYRQYQLSLKNFRLAAKLSTQLLDSNALGRIYNNSGIVLQEQGLNREAEQTFNQSIAYFYAVDSSRAASSLHNLGNLHFEAGKPLLAKTKLEQALIYARRLQEPDNIMFSTSVLAQVYQRLGLQTQSRELYKESFALKDSLMSQALTRQLAESQSRAENLIKDQRIEVLGKNLEIQKLDLARNELIVERRNLALIAAVVSLLGLAAAAAWLLNRQRLKAQKTLRQEEKRRHSEALSAEEKERSRIAQELHDGVGQLLASVRLRLEASQMPQDRLDDAVELLDESAQEVRLISHNLSPHILSRFGLERALSMFAQRMSRRGVQIHLSAHTNPARQLDPSYETGLFRIIQELVTNAIRHGKAQQVFLNLEQEEDQLTFSVEDDGQGFDASKQVEGIGLANIRSRLANMGGELTIDAEPGRGSLFMAHIPLQHLHVSA